MSAHRARVATRLATRAWVLAVGLLVGPVGVVAVASVGRAAAQTGGCVATGSGTSWQVQEPGAGVPTAGIAVGAPGGVGVESVSVPGATGQESANGLPAETSLEFLADQPDPAGQSITASVTTTGPVSGGTFTTYLVNATKSGYLGLVSCPIQSTTPVTPAPITPSTGEPGVPHSVSSSSTDLDPLWYGLIGLGLALILGFVCCHTGKKNGGYCGKDEDEDDGDTGCSPCGWLRWPFGRSDRWDGTYPDWTAPRLDAPELPGFDRGERPSSGAGPDVM